MKKVLVLLAVILAFAFMAMAQTSASAQSSSGDMGQSQQGTKTKSHMGKSHMGKANKESTLTGCLSKEPNADGMYTLSNGRYKKGVEVGPTDKVKEHAGHQVALKGEWSTAAAAGETAGGGMSKEKGEKHFEVASLKHISETCKEAPGGGTTGMTKKGAKDTSKGKSTGANPPQQ